MGSFRCTEDPLGACDVAIIVLDDDPGNRAGQLGEAGLLGQLKADRVLKGTRFTAVGYGTVRVSMTQAFDGILDNLDRRRAEQGFNSLTNAWLKLPTVNTPGNVNAEHATATPADPHFTHLNGVESDIVASITVTGDAQCKATDVTYRMDTSSARGFLDAYVKLPSRSGAQHAR